MPTTQCGNFTCDNMSSYMAPITMSTCSSHCCEGNLCNQPPVQVVPTSVHQTTPCLMSPCRNGGSCIPTRRLNGQDYTCMCRTGFSGRNCENAARLTCFTGMTSSLGDVGNMSLMLTSCSSGENYCMMSSMAGDYGFGQEVTFYVGQCTNQLACGTATCSSIVSALGQFNITACNTTCCDTDYCNVAPNRQARHNQLQPPAQLH
uniref:EGF-like domain-containing protein n=1 Tax=Ciona savignyi TaxID=51511 RepID=H2Z1K2_CIOSA